MAYNPYNAIKGIYDSKVAYHTNQSKGLDPNEYHKQALPYYTELAQNGYESLAAQLDSMDAVQAAELLKQFKPDEQFAVDEAYNTMTGNAQQNGGDRSASYTGLTDKANGIINASHPNDATIDKLMGMGTGETGMAQDVFNTAQGISTGAIQTKPNAATQSILDAYNDSNNRLNGAIQYDQNGNVISGLNTEHYNIGRNQLDYLNNFDVTKQPYYQGIMDAYKLGGYNAAQGEYANGAANNGGNIDSYAAANANRQQLAYTTAGMQQAMAMANQNQQNWQNLYSQMSKDLDNQGQLSLQTLDIARQMYATDANERMNALDQAGSLAAKQMENSVAVIQSMIDERVKDKGITADMAMKEADIAAELDKLAVETARYIEEAKIEQQTRMYESDNSLKGTMYTSDNDLAGTKYKADADVTSTGIRADADKYSADRSAQASMYGAQQSAAASMYGSKQSADASKYTADQNYAARKYEADTGLTKQELDNMSAYEIAQLQGEYALKEAEINAKKQAGVIDDSGFTRDEITTGALNILQGYSKNPDGSYDILTLQDGSPVTTWSALEVYLGNALNSSSEAQKVVKDWQSRYPDLMDNYATIIGKNQTRTVPTDLNNLPKSRKNASSY